MSRKRAKQLLAATISVSLLCLLCLLTPKRTLFTKNTADSVVHSIDSTRKNDDSHVVAVTSSKSISYRDYVKIETLACQPGRTMLRIHFGDCSIGEATVDGRQYSIVRMEGCTTCGRAGEPLLPVFTFDVVAGGDARCRVADGEWEEVRAKPPMPSKGALWRSSGFEGNGAENRGIYGGGLFPQDVSRIQRSFMIREVSGAEIALSPVCYDFSRGVMRVARALDICIEDDGDASFALDSNASFANMQSELFVNSSILEPPKGSSIGTLLVVIPDEWQEAVADFAAWKRRIGFSVSVCRYPSETGDGPDALSDYIRGEYIRNAVTHIILCGDADDVPPAYTSANTRNPGILAPTSDTRYAFLSGEDCIADSFISRMPAHSTEELSAVLSKIISYESQPPDDDSWRQKPLMLCSLEKGATGRYRNMSDYELIKANYDDLVENNVFVGDDSRLLCGSDATSERISAALNGDGAACCYYLGHGKYDSFVMSDRRFFTATDAISLRNGMHLPFFVAPVCDSGNFANPAKDSVSESFFLNGSNSENGAIAVISATSNTLWNPPIALLFKFSELLKGAYSAQRCLSAGEYFQRSLLAAIQLATTEGSQLVDSASEYTASQMLLFGDCSMMPRMRTLRPVEVETLKENGSVTVHVKWGDDAQPVKGAYVSIVSDDGNVVESAATGSDGSAALSTKRFFGTVTLNVNDSSFRPFSSKLDIGCGIAPYEDADGFVANDVLLAFLEHAKDCPECRLKVELAVESWRKGGGEPPSVEEGTITGASHEMVDDGLNSHGGIMAELDALATQFCEKCRVEYIGQSANGRDVKGVCICAAEEENVPHLIVAAGVGDDESVSPQIALHLARFLLEEGTLATKAAVHIVPLLDPDGWEGDERVQPYPMAPEALAFDRWARLTGSTAAVVLRAGGATVAYPSELSSSPLFSELCHAWLDNCGLFSNWPNNASRSSVADSMTNNGILGIDVDVGLSNRLEDKELKSLCKSCEAPFAAWCRVASRGVSVSLADGFPLQKAEVACGVMIDGELCGRNEGGGRKVRLSRGRKWFRTLLAGEHEITVPSFEKRRFTVSEGVCDIMLDWQAVESASIHGIACTPEQFIPGHGLLLEAEYVSPKASSVIWNVALPYGWRVFGDSAEACRIEQDGSTSLLFLDAPKQGTLQCRVMPPVADGLHEAPLKSLLLRSGNSSYIYYILYAQPKHTVAFRFERGWNLVGSTMTAPLPSGLKAWMYDGQFRETDSLLPGRALWIHSEKDFVSDIIGWESSSYKDIPQSGWRLFSPLRHKRAAEGCFEFIRGVESYRRADGVLKPGRAYWRFGE